MPRRRAVLLSRGPEWTVKRTWHFAGASDTLHFMAHSHHHHDHHHHKPASNLDIAFFLNVAFTLIEIVGGLLTNSVAILADAVHDAADSCSLGLAWYLERFSRREPDSQFTYGYQRFSVLGALVTGVLLVVGLGFVLWQAVPRLLAPEEVHAPGVMVLAAVGVVMNGAAFLKLRGGTSLNQQIVGWHLLEDTLGWIAVLVGGVVIYLFDLSVVDPLLSIGISLYVLRHAVRSLWRVFEVLLQRAPGAFDIDQFVEGVKQFPKVVSLHHAHVWTLDGEHHVLTCHVVMQQSATRDDVVAMKGHLGELAKAAAIHHVTVEVELEEEACSSSFPSQRRDGVGESPAARDLESPSPDAS